MAGDAPKSSLNQKAMPKFSGWQRLGMVVTVCWLVGAIDGGRFYQYHNGLDVVNASINLCTHHGKPYEQCRNDDSDFRRIMIEPYWPPVFLLAFGPLPLFWLFGWTIIKTARWVRAGFVA